MSLWCWCGFEFIGKAFGENKCVPEVGDPPNFQPSILVDGGIAYVSFFKKLLIPCYARIETVKKGCYGTVDKPKCEKKKRPSCRERRCKRRAAAQASACPPKPEAEDGCKKEEPSPSDRDCRLNPKKRCSGYCS
ncbi:uncharacterized protein [Onthophagus taurus]|uniref:uncharacterized protein n=1 Tax=Onthophagus taurus TaxID=166361 RepID=UPI000C20D1D2|nr:uncharacterized protein LOC111428043 [Onthophagus taurus]